MQRDVSGWMTRLDDEMVARYTASGHWRNVTLDRSARDMARKTPDRIAVVDGAVAVTFAQVFERATRLAAVLKSRGLNPGEVISFQLPNWHETMVINLAATLGGFVCNPIVPIYRDVEVSFILKHSRSRVLFMPEMFRSIDYVEMIERLRPDLPELSDVVLLRSGRVGYATYDAWLEEVAVVEPSSVYEPDPNAVKLLLYTSGTTGDPKGVLHSHNTLRTEIDAVTQFWKLTADDVVLMPSPVTHITGYLYALELPFATGIKAVFMDRWNVADAVELIARHGASFSIGATTFLVDLVEAVDRQKTRLPSLRLFASGGAPVPPEVIKRAANVLPNCLAFRAYGCSEAPTVSLGLAEGDPPELAAATDGCIFNHDVRIAGPDGQSLAEGEEGEILTRGPEVMLGYTNWDYTLEAFDPDGYFRTGDLGYVSHGRYLTISGRKKDLIIRGGENISPKEIEDVIHRHPAVLEAAVVAMPHPRMGETPCVYVVLRPGTTLDSVRLAAFLEDAKLARQKFPERLFVVDELPRTASGKVLKNVLRARVRDGV